MLTLVKFESKTCGPCKSMEPILERIAEDLEVYVTRVDVQKSAALTMEYGITSIPTFLVIKNEEIIGSRVGSCTYEEMRSWLDEFGVVKSEPQTATFPLLENA